MILMRAICTFREEDLHERVLAVEHCPGEVPVQRGVIARAEVVGAIRHGTSEVLDPAKERGEEEEGNRVKIGTDDIEVFLGRLPSLILFFFFLSPFSPLCA